MSTYQLLIKSMLYSSMVFLSGLVFVSCGNDRSVDSTEVAAAQIQPVAVSTKENDKQFLLRAVEMKYEQILIGKLAQTRSSSEEIKALAKMLEEANRAEKSSLASLGYMKSIVVPSAPTQSAHDAYNKLNEATVDDFDFAYISLAVKGHQDAVGLFESVARGQIDPDIQAHAATMLPEMRNLLSKAMEVETMMNPVSALVQ